jgi:hypothetical protein
MVWGLGCAIARQQKRLDLRDQAFLGQNSCGLEFGIDGRENLADQRAHDGNSSDDDHSHEHQDQGVLNHALTFFLESEFHDV